MKDLSVYYLADSAVLEEIIDEGPPYEDFVFSDSITVGVDENGNEIRSQSAYAGRTVFTLKPSLSADFTEAFLNRTKLSIVRDQSSTLGPNQFRLLAGTGPNGEDQIEISDPLSGTLKVYAVSLSDENLTQLRIIGKNFRQGSEFRFGGSRVETFEVKTSTEAIAIVSSNQVTVSNINNAKILNSSGLIQREAEIVFDLSTRAKSAKNTEILVQRFLTLLMDDRAGRLHQLLPKSRSLTPRVRAIASARVSAAIRVVSSIIKATTPEGADPSEVLLSAQVGGVTIDDESGSISVQVNITTGSGTANIPLTL